MECTRNKKGTIYGYGQILDKSKPTNIKSYIVWKSMLSRCYGIKNLDNKNQRPYINCYVSEDWLIYDNFEKWFNQNYIEGYFLDKDLLVKNNKIYSANTCCFIPHQINEALTTSKIKRGEFPIGVSFEKRTNKFKAYISMFGKRKTIGRYNSPEEAFQNYQMVRKDYLSQLAEIYKDKISDKAYQALINYPIEITD